MADLLRTGHTMLNIACPICNNPIFKNREGKKFCPSCNREVIVSNSISDQKIEESKEKSNYIHDIKNTSNKEVENSIRKVIVEKINFILEKLEIATETELIKKYSNILSGLYDLFMKLT